MLQTHISILNSENNGIRILPMLFENLFTIRLVEYSVAALVKSAELLAEKATSRSFITLAGEEPYTERDSYSH